MSTMATAWQAPGYNKPANQHEQPVLQDLMAGASVDPRPYQLRIISKAIRMFEGQYINMTGETEEAAGSVMVESPTGSGKTVMGLTIARHLQREKGLSVGWVAMRRNLLTQAEEENRRRGFDVEMHQISMFDKNPPKVDVMVVDEAQHDGAMSMANLHCMVKPKMVLGLTATPFRTDRIKLCFDKVITDVGIHQLIQDGYLSRYHHYTIPEYTPANVADFYAKDRQRWGKSLIFFHKVTQCQECQQALAAHGIHADVVTAKSNRDKQLADFLSGKTDVLINMSILTEGFDCPALKTVFCRPSGKSCTIQMAGRVFRQHAGLNFKQVVQCKRTPHPMVKTAMADEQYVWMDQQWRSLTLNKQIAAITARSRKMIAQANVELPQLVAAHRARPMPWDRDNA